MLLHQVRVSALSPQISRRCKPAGYPTEVSAKLREYCVLQSAGGNHYSMQTTSHWRQDNLKPSRVLPKAKGTSVGFTQETETTQ